LIWRNFCDKIVKVRNFHSLSAVLISWMKRLTVQSYSEQNALISRNFFKNSVILINSFIADLQFHLISSKNDCFTFFYTEFCEFYIWQNSKSFTLWISTYPLTVYLMGPMKNLECLTDFSAITRVKNLFFASKLRGLFCHITNLVGIKNPIWAVI